MHSRQINVPRKPCPLRSGSRSNERQKLSYDTTACVPPSRPSQALSKSFESQKPYSLGRLAPKAPSKQSSQIFLNSRRPRFFKSNQNEENKHIPENTNLGYGKILSSLSVRLNMCRYRPCKDFREKQFFSAEISIQYSQLL